MIRNGKHTGFSHNPFMMGYDSQIYDGDEELGFVFPKRKLITSSGFSTLGEIIKDIERGEKVVLNMGDSSTSGWNSNKIYNGNKNPHAPFFSYKTYSQLMEEQSDMIVINAGVPGYSSLQGKKYLEQLLKRLAIEKIKVHYVTAYFGNNDATYNKHEDKVRLDGKNATTKSDGSRVGIEDFKRNIRDIVETAHEYGAEPILIMPAIHYDWEPGIRSEKFKGEFKEALGRLSDERVRKDLEKAIKEYKKGNYEKALELDKVIPRIKLKTQLALREVAEEMQVPLIDIQQAIPETDHHKYFVDYCHPLEPANQLIADKFFEITETEKGKREPKVKTKAPLKYEMLKGAVNILGYLIRTEKEQEHQPSEDIYALQ